VALFLSGGVDSSLIAAKASALQPNLKSFSIGFDDGYLDESPYAAQVADYFSLDHNPLKVTEADALALVPTLPSLMDIPLGDGAILPTALIAKLAGASVRVALSGDGADELFGGYRTHVSVADDWRALSGIPCRKAFGTVLGLIPAAPINAVALAASDLFGRKRRSLPGHRLAKFATLLQADSPSALSGLHRTLWRGLPPRVTGAKTRIPDAWNALFTLADPESEAMLADVQTYLPDDLCVKTDRATMAASLEARLPFLDHNLAQVAWSLPLPYKIASNQNKAVLRALLSRHLPSDLVQRPKHGLEVPTGQWLRGALKEWAGDLLSPDRLFRQGLIDPIPVEQAWNLHQSGGKGWGNELWGMAVLQAWLDDQKN
jgi:asparagine synthase (glutamine-hydrolysing)